MRQGRPALLPERKKQEDDMTLGGLICAFSSFFLWTCKVFCFVFSLRQLKKKKKPRFLAVNSMRPRGPRYPSGVRCMSCLLPRKIVDIPPPPSTPAVFRSLEQAQVPQFNSPHSGGPQSFPALSELGRTHHHESRSSLFSFKGFLVLPFFWGPFTHRSQHLGHLHNVQFSLVISTFWNLHCTTTLYVATC